MRAGDTLELLIGDDAIGGSGVGRHEGMAVFVPFALRGERVRIEVVRVRKRHAEARLLAVLEPAAGRVEAACPLFGDCPGCAYQHADYATQLALRTRQVQAALERLGGLPTPTVLPTVPSPLPLGYRNKLVLHGPGRPGFVRPADRSLLPIPRCPLAADALNERLAAVRWDLDAEENLVLRRTGDGTTWCSLRDPPAQALHETLDGMTFEVPPLSFFQVNPPVAELLVRRVRARLQERPRATCLLDVCCGVGVFALLLAKQAHTVLGLEIDPAAIRAARRNAQRNGVSNVEFRCGDAAVELERLAGYAPPAATVLLLDPPRAGCSRALLDALVRVAPARLLYVSCDPATQARDLRALVAAGYRFIRAEPFDMFPQTAHVEVLAELERPADG